MLTEYFSTAQVAQIFNVSVETVKSWRSPICENSPLRLVGEATAKTRYRYELEALKDFAERNPKYKPALILHLAPGTTVEVKYTLPPDGWHNAGIAPTLQGQS